MHSVLSSTISTDASPDSSLSIHLHDNPSSSHEDMALHSRIKHTTHESKEQSYYLIVPPPNLRTFTTHLYESTIIAYPLTTHYFSFYYSSPSQHDTRPSSLKLYYYLLPFALLFVFVIPHIRCCHNPILALHPIQIALLYHLHGS